ncbi:alpha/beta fold hydrolase [Paraburkholderia sp. IMGN_8]|uniref:alpha/beta hydrolase family protein n=1 Tax=Paraburkholderia sp. IMGN_8 TaxID=3136564 RepID=UPI0031018CD5
MLSEKLEFPGPNGQKLSGRLDRPDTPPRAYALFAHCFTCGKDIVAAHRIAQALTVHGIAVLRFDFTGIGGSEGEFSETNFSSNCLDLIAAANFLRTSHCAPTLMIGHSLGGAAVLASASSIPEIRAVVTIAAPSDPAHVTGHFGAQLSQIDELGEAQVQVAGRVFKIKRQFITDAHKHRLADRVAQLKRPLMVMHAPGDTTVGIENANAIFKAAKHPKSFFSLDNADHLVTQKEDALYIANTIAAWSERYLAAI